MFFQILVSSSHQSANEWFQLFDWFSNRFSVLSINWLTAFNYLIDFLNSFVFCQSNIWFCFVFFFTKSVDDNLNSQRSSLPQLKRVLEVIKSHLIYINSEQVLDISWKINCEIWLLRSGHWHNNNLVSYFIMFLLLLYWWLSLINEQTTYFIWFGHHFIDIICHIYFNDTFPKA